METEPKVGFAPDLPLDHPDVEPVLGEQISYGGHVMIARVSRWGRSHVKLHRGRDGRYFVRRGRAKEYLDRCDVTYLDGKPMLHAFKFEKTVSEIEAERRLAAQDAEIRAKYGME